jgi:hypothetical protein
LKKNVYQNYKQFIETAKEISYLESEMYQLSHMITEQRNLLTCLMETSILGEKVRDFKIIDAQGGQDAPHVPPEMTSKKFVLKMQKTL